MSTNIQPLKRRIRRFERWFDRRFGWFFTNGMKRGPRVEPADPAPPAAVEDVRSPSVKA
jgi:hypothetical protein